MASETTIESTDQQTTKTVRVPGWANRAAHLIAYCTIPSALWRIGIILGVPMIYDHDWITRSRLDTLSGALYLLGLCLLSEILALLAFGLVRPWGEITPRWLGPAGGRRIPRLLPILIAGAAAVALCIVWTVGVPVAAITQTPFDPQATWGTASAVQLATYAPMMLWGPLLGALVIHYASRTSQR